MNVLFSLCYNGIMKRYCTVCHSIHDGRCQRPRQWERRRNSDADLFRNTQVWRRMAALILERDYHCCRMCAKAGIINSRELSVHHIIPIAADYDKRLDDDNLITLCRYHHEQAERGAIKARELREIVAQGIPPTLLGE